MDVVSTIPAPVGTVIDPPGLEERFNGLLDLRPAHPVRPPDPRFAMARFMLKP